MLFVSLWHYTVPITYPHVARSPGLWCRQVVADRLDEMWCIRDEVDLSLRSEQVEGLVDEPSRGVVHADKSLVLCSLVTGWRYHLELHLWYIKRKLLFYNFFYNYYNKTLFILHTTGCIQLSNYTNNQVVVLYKKNLDIGKILYLVFVIITQVNRFLVTATKVYIVVD